MSISTKFIWPNTACEPVLITYNRAQQLKTTLEAFMQAGLHESMKLHILDNHSTDETAAIVKNLQASWPMLTYHCNPFNIGGNANILRAVELTNTSYHWVIGDDDHWLLQSETLIELAQQLKMGSADVIRLGWLVSPASRGITYQATRLLNDENMLFASMSMISATIIKRDIVTRYLPLAYHNISDSYPQLIALIRATEETDLQIYTLKSDLLIHTPSREPGYFSGDFEWYAGWYRTARFFSKINNKKCFVNEATFYMCREKPSKLNQFIWLVKVLFYYKSYNLNQWPYLLSMLAYGVGWRLRIFSLMVLNALTPGFFLKFARGLFFKLNKMPAKEIRIDRTRL